MPGKPQGRVRQQAAAGRDVNQAGRDQVVVSVAGVGVAGVGAAEPVVPGLLPRDIPAFTGRTGELDRLTAMAAGGLVVVTAIGGAAGVGKTALAVHAAYRLLPDFPDGHLYADLRGYAQSQAPAEPDEVLEVFLRRLSVPTGDIPAQTEERSGLLRQLLASRQMLMLLDNAATEAQVRPLLPGAGRSLVLITSRSLLPGLEVNQRISLDVLAEEEATAMLAGLIGNERAAAEPKALAQVRDWCGRLPLALQIAGQLLAAHPTWPVARLAGMLASEQDRLAQLAVGDLQVRAAFMVSYRQLPEADARMFRLLGLHPGPDFGAAAAAVLAGTDLDSAGLTLDRLVLASLVSEVAGGRFGIHDLLHLFARQMCQGADDQAARDAAERRLVGYYTDLARFLDSCLDPRLRPAAAAAAQQAGGTLPTPREALAMFETERADLLLAAVLAAQRGWDELACEISERTAEWLSLLRYLDDALTVHEAALAAARHARDTAAESRALGNLGLAYSELRRFGEAIDCYQQDLAICRETGDLDGKGQTLNNLGITYHELRQFREAIGYCQQALGIRRGVGDRVGEGRTMNNLGLAYSELRCFEEAIDCCQQALAISRETGDRHGESRTLDNLGLAYSKLRRFEEAIDCCQQALAISRETGDRHGEGQTLDNLGLALSELRRFGEAIDCYQQALAISRETGDRHGEGQTLHNLGFTYIELRRFEEAIDCYQRALGIRRETGDRHYEGQTLHNLGVAYRKLRQSVRAAGCWQDAAAAMRDAGDHDQAAYLEQMAARALSRRRWWWRR